MAVLYRVVSLNSEELVVSIRTAMIENDKLDRQYYVLFNVRPCIFL